MPETPLFVGDRPVAVDLVSTFSPKHGAAIGESLGPEALAGDLMGEYGDKVDVDHIDLQLDPDLQALAERVYKHRPHILGLSVKIGAHDQAAEVMKRIKAMPWGRGEEPLIVMGSVVPTFAAGEMLKRHPNTIMALKEGEHTMRAMVQVIRGERELEQVPGIMYLRPGDSPIVTPPQRLDLAGRHLPARITTPRIVEELNGMPWAEASRGCSWNCTFCSIHDLHGGGFDGSIRPESAVDDLENLQRLGIQAVSFTDDDFGGDPERTLEIARLIQERGIKIKFTVSTRADHIWMEKDRRGHRAPEELEKYNQRLRHIMAELRKAGLVRVFIGMESGSPTQLKRYGKQVSVEGNYRALEILAELGIDAVAGYIPIDQLMTLQELAENLKFLRRTGMYRKVTNPLSILRVQEGAPYMKDMRNKGLLGGRTDDLVFYESQFAHPVVQRVAELADRWVNDIYMLIFGLKGEVATVSLGPGGLMTEQATRAQRALYAFRELEMEFIEAVTGALLENPNAVIDHIINDFVLRRQGLVEQTALMIQKGELGGNGRLFEAIKDLTI